MDKYVCTAWVRRPREGSDGGDPLKTPFEDLPEVGSPLCVGKICLKKNIKFSLGQEVLCLKSKTQNLPVLYLILPPVYLKLFIFALYCLVLR